MRLIPRLAPAGLAVLALAACEAQSPGEKVIRQSQPIQGGTVDQGDPNVIGILINTSQGMSLCSGSLVAPNLVLTAHHCVANPPSNLVCGASFSPTYAASSFLVTTSYDAAAQIFNGGGSSLPAADGVTWWAASTVAVPGSDVCGDDLAALTLSQSVTGVCPLIPAVDVNVTDGEAYTAIGFGITSPSGQTAGTRYKVGGLSVQCIGSSDCQDNSIAATAEWVGGTTGNEGTCEGDSGGPAIDAQGRVIGSVSRGPANACNSTVYEGYYAAAAWIKSTATAAASAGGYAAAGWVTGGATSNPANGYCNGSSSSSSSGGGSGSGSGSGSSSGGSSSGSSSGGSGSSSGSASSGSSSGGASSGSSSGGASSGSSSGGASSGSSSGGASSGSSSGTVGVDAGVAAADAGQGGDPNYGLGGSSSGCSVPRGSAGPGGLAWLSVGGLAVLARRRRSSRG